MSCPHALSLAVLISAAGTDAARRVKSIKKAYSELAAAKGEWNAVVNSIPDHLRECEYFVGAGD